MSAIVGSHIRIDFSFEQSVQRAIRLKSPILQCFFVHQETNSSLRLTLPEISQFLANHRSFFSHLFLHGSYAINLSGERIYHSVLDRELMLARRLGFTHVVIHPGSAKRLASRMKGVEQLARSLNLLTKQEREIRFVLENVAQGGMTIGGTLFDFAHLKSLLDVPESVEFCIDTAHAHSYGYDLVSSVGREQFVAEVEKAIGWNSVALVHLNDTQQPCASRIDQHCCLGNGFLGAGLSELSPLRALARDPFLIEKPCILELPIVSELQEFYLLEVVRAWRFAERVQVAGAEQKQYMR